MTSESRRIPEGVLERYLAEDLPAEEKARVEALLAESPLDRARVEELRADSAAFLVLRPPRAMMERFEQAQRRAKWWRWPALLTPALVSVALIGLAVLRRPMVDDFMLKFLRPPGEDILSKGGVVLELYRKTATGSAKVFPEVPLAPGDTLGFKVKESTRGFIAIVSKDGSGAVSVYYPYNGAAAAPYEPKQPDLPGAVELDDTLGHEDIHALYSTKPFELAWALKALREGRPLDQEAPRGVSVGHASFTKKAAP